MKNTIPYALSLLALGGVVPCLAAEAPAAAATSELPAPVVKVPQYYYAMSEHFEMTVDFPVPMVPESAVGKPAEPGVVKVSHADAISMVWLSQSRLLLKPTRELPRLEVFTLEVPEGVKGLKGEAISPLQKKMATCVYFYGYSVGRCENGDILLRADSEDYAKILKDRISEVFYEMKGKRYLVASRPATVADVLANWDAFKSCVYHDVSDEDRAAATRLPQDELVPNTWVLELPGCATEYGVGVRMPRLRWDEESQSFVPGDITNIEQREWSHVVTNTYQESGKYVLELKLDMPAAATTAEELISQFEWGVMPADSTAPDYQKMEWRDGALRARVKEKEVVIVPQKLHLRDIRMMDGSVKQGCTGLTLMDETGGQEIKLRTVGLYKGLVAYDEDNPPEVSEDVTALRPRAPYIYTDVCASQMQLRGSTTIRCRYGRVKNGKIRIWKLEGEAEDTAELLEAYGVRYTGEHLDWDDEQARKEARGTAKLNDKDFEDNRIDASDLPGVLASVERELPGSMASEINLSLAELFPGQPVGGFYMVEVEGTPLRDSKHPCINQGLVQVTDLGLLWKTNGRHLFGWAYHLSNAAEVKEARLRMLDAEGDTLAELLVKNGLVQGDFPAGTRYLQLCTADDRVVLRHDPAKLEWTDTPGSTWQNRQLLAEGICPADIPEPLVYLFSDRSLYRPGETAHIKGIMRWVKENELLLPEIESITAELHCRGEKVAELPVRMESSGSFTLDAALPAVGDYSVHFRLVYKGDKDDESPDKAVLKGKELPSFYLNRSESICLTCREFRRNEFEVESRLSVDAAKGEVQVAATAVNLTTTPVAQGNVEWNLLTEQRHFHPSQPQWAGFRFSDYTDAPWSYYKECYGDYAGCDGRQHESQSGTLNDAGQGSVTFSLPKFDNPGALRVVSTTIVTNGNEQSVRSVQEQLVHPSAVYGGIRPESVLAQAGSKLPVELVAVKPDGSAWDGAPLAAELTVKRTVFRPYRYGSVFKSTIRNVVDEDTERKIPVSLTGSPQRLEIPLEGAGHYDVELRGRDADGREFYSATRHYVWGDDVSPWEYLNDTGLRLLPEKALYQPGETARILVQTPVDAELLVTVERGKVLRHYRRKVTVANPVIEVPLVEDDAPGVYVSVSLVQNAGARGADGKPLLKMGACEVHVEAAARKLNVQLQAPQQSLLPGEPCRVSGVITDAAGKPVANAEVTLFAEDEGTLQVMGYDLPEPGRYFHKLRYKSHCVSTFSGLGQLVSENLGSRFFGNKGVFIGGGGEDEYGAALTDVATSCLRHNFNPCALWLSSVKTDAQGRFSATYANPDTLTRYRLMAVAAAGDKFGSGEAAYHVTKPVMLEPAAPMSATQGDELMLPVTLSMLPGELPESAGGAPIRWLVVMGGQKVKLPQRHQVVTLQGDAPVTVHFPVQVNRTGTVKLQWSVQAETATRGSVLERCSDAVQLSFEVVPPMPYIRENFTAVLQPGQTGNLGQWMRGDFLPASRVEVNFSTSPLGGIGYPMQYLFTYPYGCSEQLSSTVIPWIFREELESALGISFPEDKDTAAVLADVDARLARRLLSSGEYRASGAGYSYWDGGTEPCGFSPYVAMVRLMMNRSGSKYQHRRLLTDELKAEHGQPVLALVALALTDEITKSAVDTVLERLEKRRDSLSAQELWALALCARVADHDQAAGLKKKAGAAEPSKYEDYHLPPVRALQCLLAVAESPKSSATAEMLRRYVLDEGGQHSSWRNAWMVLSVARYVKASKQRETRALLNGEPVTAAAPQKYSLLASSTMVPFKAEKNPVYVYGQVEGFLNKVQPTSVVDQGFAVQRVYEALQPDGSWKPTASFRVGDVVRVTLSAEATSAGDNLRYVVLEDRLPAAFEAVDPVLGSQGLPAGVSGDSGRFWWQSSDVSHREFLKDRVRVFVDNWGMRRSLEVRYVARVVRSGRVTAPGAKVELMYRPEVHGLSIPQQFEVQSR